MKYLLFILLLSSCSVSYQIKREGNAKVLYRGKECIWMGDTTQTTADIFQELYELKKINDSL